MNMMLVTTGIRGDIQPFIALAVRQGHRVTLVTHYLFFQPAQTGLGEVLSFLLEVFR